MLGVVARNLAENAIRYAGPGAERDALGSTRGRRGRADRGRRRSRRRPGRPAAPVRALLPGRPLAGIARHRARPRDRQARRHVRRRDGRGARRPRSAASRSAASFPTRVVAVHHSVTGTSPAGSPGDARQIARLAGRLGANHDGASNDNELMSLAEIAAKHGDAGVTDREAVFEVRDLSVSYSGSRQSGASTSTSTRTR